jgi:hypothetical protein
MHKVLLQDDEHPPEIENFIGVDEEMMQTSIVRNLAFSCGLSGLILTV